MNNKASFDSFGVRLDDHKILSIICAYFPDNEIISNLASSLSTVGDVVIVKNGGAIGFDLGFQENLISIVKPNRNLGTLASYNLIIKDFREYSYYWLWNQDTEISKEAAFDFVRKAKNVFIKDESVVCVTIFDKKNFVSPVDKGLILARESTTMINKNRLLKTLPDGFDENLFMDYGDWDFSYRLYRAGGRVIQIDGVPIDHQLGEPEKTIFGAMNRSSPMRLRMQGINTAYFLRKHGILNFPSALLVARLLFLPIKNFLFKHSIKRSMQFLSGLMSGIKGELSSSYAASLNRNIK